MFTLKSVLTLVLCITQTASLHPKLLPRNVQHSCMTKVLSKLMKDDEFLAITWSRHIEDELEDNISKLFSERSMLILNDWKIGSTNPSKINWKPVVVIIVASTKVDIADRISSLYNTNAWSFMSKFIVVYSDNSGKGRIPSSDIFLKDIFQTFANLNAFNVHMIYKFDEDEIDEFSWSPHADSNCDSVNRVRLISECAIGFHRIHQIFNDADKLERNCTITAAIRSLEPYSFYSNETGFSKGIEIDLVREWAHWMHLNVELKAMVNAINNVEGAELEERNVDLIIGAFDAKLSELSVDFHFDQLTWCVKKADLYEPWRSTYMIVSWPMWIVVVLGNYFVAVTLFLFYKNYHHPENFHYCTGIAVLCLFSIPVPYNPTLGIARIHFGIVLIYGLVAFIAVNCFLTSLMTKPPYKYQVHTVNDLIHYEYTIFVDAGVVSLHHLGNDKISAYTKVNYEHCYEMIQCLNQLIERPKVAAIVPRKFAKHIQSTTELPIFCFADDESFSTYARSIRFNRSNSFLLNKFNSFIQITGETGHLLKWEAVGAGHNKYANENGPMVFNVKHVYGIFLGYAVGTIAGVLAFIGELLTFKNMKNGNRFSRCWKYLDEFVFSTERILLRKHLVDVNRQQGFIDYIP